MHRRDVLRILGQGSAGLSLSALHASLSAATGDADDYKAVVCIFLFGGNDQSNTVVPTATSAYQAYKAARPTLALSSGSLLALDGVSLGLHPNLAELRTLYNSGKAALVANVGPLLQPVTRAQWNSGRPTVPVPTQLFSHSDQAAHWQTATPSQSSRTGWLGRLSDALGPVYNGTSTAPFVISAGASNIVTVGNSVQPFQVATSGAATPRMASYLFGANQTAATTRKVLAPQTQSNLLMRQWSAVGEQALNTSDTINTALNSVSVNTAFPATGLGQQLKTIARLIAARARLGQRRQVYFASMIGFDHHDDLLVNHGKKLLELSQAIKAFYDSTVELGVQNQVTTFTASDFGRALLSNGKGSDHGWGGHHFVVGGAVAGGRVIGTFPTVALNGPEDAGQGRLIPTLGMDQYAATIAQWLGADASALNSALPNLGNFSLKNLGFLTG